MDGRNNSSYLMLKWRVEQMSRLSRDIQDEINFPYCAKDERTGLGVIVFDLDKEEQRAVYDIIQNRYREAEHEL